MSVLSLFFQANLWPVGIVCIQTGPSRLYSQQRWMAKTEVVLSHCIWLASTNVVSTYEVGYSWVLTLVVFTAFLDQDLWPQFFLRGFKFGSTSRCSFIQSGFWSDFWVLCLNNWIEQVEILSMYMQQSWEHLMLDQVSSVVSVLLHKYFYCSMVAERACSSGGQPSLDSPFWEQGKHSWAFWSIFWRIFTSWLHPGWRLLRCSGLEFILFLDLASHLVGPSWKRQALYIYPQCLHTSFQRSSSSDKIEQLFTLCARS